MKRLYRCSCILQDEDEAQLLRRAGYTQDISPFPPVFVTVPLVQRWSLLPSAKASVTSLLSIPLELRCGSVASSAGEPRGSELERKKKNFRQHPLWFCSSQKTVLVVEDILSAEFSHKIR